MKTSLRGLMFAATSALSLSVLTTAAVFAYKGGSEPLTLVAARAATGFLAACTFVLVYGHAIRFPRNARFLILVFSASQLMINYGYMTSVLFIPVSLAALIFYIFPVLVLIIESVLARRLPSALEIGSFSAAFIGLALALGPSFETLDWRGITAALVAASGGALGMVAGSRAVRRSDMLSTFFQMQLIACTITATVMLSFGGPVLPTFEIGWWGLGVACTAYTLGIATQVIAVKIVDPAPVALIYNLEPVATVIIATLLLAERLDTLQYAGGLIVLTAVYSAGRRLATQSTH